MRLQSILNPGMTVSFREAVDRGIATDGGLFMPVEIPTLSKDSVASMRSMTFVEIAFEVARCLLAGDIPDADLREVVEQSMTFPVPIRVIGDRTSVLELFHGPTLAFKDFGARFMAQTMAYLHKNNTQERTILVATSGDTGSAVAHGFHNVPGMKVCLLYPSRRVSAIQELQLTSLKGNVTALEIEGSFDDCQRLVKEAFADTELSKEKRLTSANSINVARLFPQTFYYFDAYAHRPDAGRPLAVSVPSGNLGNLTAGLMAWKMGLPVDRFIAATNMNDVLPRFLKSGVFAPGRSISTISNAMDVGNPSNFARVTYLFGNDVNNLRRILSSASYSDEDTRRMIVGQFNENRYILDPHGAVAALALRDHFGNDRGEYAGIILETAHPAKFMDTYEDRMKKEIEVPERLRTMMLGTKHSVKLTARYNDLKMFLMND
ncbi:MAG TPA: threonine synthase [Bacteroidota bacterium]